MKDIAQVVEEINEYHKQQSVPETWYISDETGWVYRRSELDGQVVRINKRDTRTYHKRYVPEYLKI